MRVLFVGNSHTYFNDLPFLFAELMRAAGRKLEVTMLSRGGESLSGHIANEQTRFNILYGGYDWVILQQVANSFPPLDEYLADLRVLKGWCDRASSRCALYMNFESPCDTPPLEKMRPVVLEAGRRMGLPVARVGEAFAKAAAQPGVDLYGPDRHHASPAGSYLAALMLMRDLFGVNVCGLPSTIHYRGETVLALEPAVARALQNTAQAL